MRLRQIRILLAIADNGLNITAAAEKLFTSQPGVSKQLKLLEEELGLKIFSRKGKVSGDYPGGRGGYPPRRDDHARGRGHTEPVTALVR